ncbi:SGNH/GDSL hydrolase family protein [Mobilicoccus pelagius]|uniref:SGNH hydrolase-type esterase domain-containing protein n=1 Tax=Mobilicoccus pelagius NBRC 104925 TaxID=1089455 RepID=H5URH3_9MICO|nr:SGNH/GDSL hydrolase family protein [Mobilicoccus pelagius]GAB48331.1 hypothetical protein MOPEL_071_00470 [Mobilicoccus pelagius NBRC 104925]
MQFLTPPEQGRRRYVAIGDSFTEGMNDPDPERPGEFRGWADRLAAMLHESAVARGGSLEYANLAIRGRKLDDVVGRQLDAALALQPDLVSIVGGGNDILRPRADIGALAAQLEDAVARIRATGADVLLVTSTDPKDAPVIRAVRGRHATYTACIWSIARRHGCAVVDQWGMNALKDWGCWSEDRLHMNAEGHRRVALAAYAALGHTDGDADPDAPMPPAPMLSRAERLRGDREWTRTHLRPWIGRRLTGRSSGDGLNPKRPTLTPPI